MTVPLYVRDQPVTGNIHKRQTAMPEWGFEPNIIRLTISRIMRWARTVARETHRRGTYRVLVWRERAHLEELG